MSKGFEALKQGFYFKDDYDRYCEKVGYKLTRAPQSWCWIKV